MLVVALAPMGLPPPANVDAGHDGPTTSHLLEADRYPSTGGRIVRNVIVGNPIPVCSDDLPESTTTAAQRWNTFFGKTVFALEAELGGFSVFESTDPERTAMASDDILGIGSVLVKQDLTGCRGVTTGCIDLDAGEFPSREWDTYNGQPVIYIEDYPTEDVLFDRRDVLPDGHARVTRTLTHELGHVFGLDDYPPRFCRDAPAGTLDRLNYTTVPTIMGPAQRVDGTTGRCHSKFPTDKDKSDYRLSYVPNDPLIFQGEGLSRPLQVNEVEIVWDAFNVHVERGFIVQRKRDNATWQTVGTHPALPSPPVGSTFPVPGRPRQRADVTLTGQPLGSQTYRVVAETHALLQDGDVAASGEIRIIVKGPPPSAPTGLTAAGVVMGIDLSWTEATDDPPIDGYQYRVDSGDWQDIPSSGPSTTSYQVRGMLVAGTSYAVQVRAVRALVPSEASASVSATPTSPPPPPSPPPTGAACLAHSGVNTYTSWRQECASSSASALLNALDDSGACGIWRWVTSTSSWERYVRTSDGTLVPGSVNFTISGGDVLWIGGCTTARDGAIGPPGPPPKELTS